MGKRTIHIMDFEGLLAVNREVVSLTKEPHEYSSADGRKLQALVQEVGTRADNEDFEEAVAEKASLLVFKLASGQYFRAGNKRTALVAGLIFLLKNGFVLDMESPHLVDTVDRAGMGAADLDDLYGLVKDSISKTKVDRRGWPGAIGDVVERHKEFLTKLAS